MGVKFSVNAVLDELMLDADSGEKKKFFFYCCCCFFTSETRAYIESMSEKTVSDFATYWKHFLVCFMFFYILNDIWQVAQ